MPPKRIVPFDIMSLPDDMIGELCRKMDTQKLSVFMGANKRLYEICQHVMEERKLMHDRRCPEIMSKISKRKNARYTFKNVKIHMHDRTFRISGISYEEEYWEFSLVKYAGEGLPATPLHSNYKIKEVIFGERRIPKISAFIIYKDKCIDGTKIVVNVYDILISQTSLTPGLMLELEYLELFLNIIIQEYKENLRSQGILPRDITFRNNYYIGNEYKNIQTLAKYHKYREGLADMHMIDDIWKNVTAENGVNYEFNTTNIAPLVDTSFEGFQSSGE